jgi:uncharacterized protein with HEPN domain
MLTIIGEAAKMISPELAQEHPEIPWREAAGMRGSSTITLAWITKQYS